MSENNEFGARAQRSAVDLNDNSEQEVVQRDRRVEQQELYARNDEIRDAFNLFREQSDRYAQSLRNYGGGAMTLLMNVFRPIPCFAVNNGSMMPNRVNSRDSSSSFNSLADKISEAITYGEADHIQVAPLDFSNVMAGYQPHVEIFLLENITVMKVCEDPRYGAPVKQDSLYQWPGGRQFYNQNPQALEDLKNLVSKPRRMLMVPQEAWKPTATVAEPSV